MELRFVERRIPAPELGENISRFVRALQWRDRNGGVMDWITVPFVAPEDEKK